MKKFTISLFMLGLVLTAKAQVGVNTINPNSTLDVNGKLGASDLDGLQAPRLTRAELTTKGNSLYGTNQKGTLIYITDISGGDAATGTPRVNVTAIGYYYFDGNAWQIISSGGTVAYTESSSVMLSGNSFQRAALTGDATAVANDNATKVVGLQGKPIAATAPTSGQVLAYNGTNWTPSAPTVSSSAVTGAASITTTSPGLSVTGTNNVLSAGTVNYNLVTGVGALASGTQGALGGTGTSNTYIGADGQKHLLPASPTTNNIYTNDGTLTANRTVSQADKALDFTSTATAGTSHFTVDGTTLNVDAVNNRVGIGTATPATRLEVNNGSTEGAIKIVDGTQGAGKVLTSDANGLGTWKAITGMDTTDDAFINDAASTTVKLGTKSDGTTARGAGTEFVIKDDGNTMIGISSPTRVASSSSGSTAAQQLAKLTVSGGDASINSLVVGLGGGQDI